MEKYFQTIFVELSDGRSGNFTGKVLVSDEDNFKDVKITNIRFSSPIELPEGVSFERLDGVEDEETDQKQLC